MSILKHFAVLGLIASGMTTAAMAQGLDRVKACFVYPGPIGDGGPSFQHHRGAEAVKAALGDRVELDWEENVAGDATAELVLEQMATAGCTIIFTTALGHGAATNAVAARFPEVKFEHATGLRRDHPNVSTYSARFHEGRAVQGLLAGRMTRTNRIGFIASVPAPEVLLGINAYFGHARRVNPNVELVLEWTGTAFDPVREARAAEAMVAAGVDVIAQHTDSTAPLEVAAGAGGAVLGFGQASDRAEFAPSPRISAIVHNWGPYYFRRIGALLDGTYAQADAWDGIGSGVVLIGQISPEVPLMIRVEAEGLRDAIAAGAYHPFTGPISRQDGTLWLAAGETASEAQLRGMDFLVAGIDGAIPP